MAKQFMFDYGFDQAPTVPWQYLKRKMALIGLTFFSLSILVGCATTSAPAPIQTPTQNPVSEESALPELPDLPPVAEVEPPTDANSPAVGIMLRDGLTPPHMTGRELKRLALLLPFSAKSSRLREEAASMMKAAELALFKRDKADTVLIALDTQGTSTGAQAAVKNASKSGVDVILGPILSSSVKAASPEARRSNIPMIAFSTDQTVAGNGTYLLSFPPEAEVKRIVDYARTLGVSRFAYIGPQSEYGRRVQSEYMREIKSTGGKLTASETYKGNDISVMDPPARRLAEVFAKAEEASDGKGPMAFEAILLPEGGTALRSLAPPLLYYEDGMAEVQFLGTGLWYREETVREPALSGGLFAGPDQEARQEFDIKFDRTYGEDPSRLASLAFDAVNFGVIIADGDPRGRRARAEDPRGFFGADGLVRFDADGTPDRGLAVYQIKNGRFDVVDPAPRTTMGSN